MMHKMQRSNVIVEGDGENILMFCTGCNEHVQFYSTGRSVRCAKALKDYYKKPEPELIDETEIDVGVVHSTIDWMASCAEEQKNHCELCDKYQRKSRKGDYRELNVVSLGDGSVLPSLYCYECAYLLKRMLDADFMVKAEEEVNKVGIPFG